MALEDFFGIWDVQLTSGTPFGIGSRVCIDPSPLGSDRARLQFESLQNSHIEAVFNPAMEALEVTTGLTGPARAMYISRYTEAASGYRAIYGLTIYEDLGRPGGPWLTVWGADMPPVALSVDIPRSIGTGEEIAEEIADRVQASSFDGTYKTASTSGAQFGIGSELVFKEGGSRITITNGLGNPISVPASLTFDFLTASLQGVTLRDQAPVQTEVWSFATYATKRYIYGLSIQDNSLSRVRDDWPEQAGACGAEEEDPEPDKKY